MKLTASRIHRLAPLILNLALLLAAKLNAAATADGDALLQFEVRASEGVLQYDSFGSYISGFVGQQRGNLVLEEASLRVGLDQSAGSAQAFVGGPSWISGTTWSSGFQHFSSAQFVINPTPEATFAAAQAITSGTVGFSITQLTAPTFDLHLDSFEYRLRIAALADPHPGSYSDGTARWLVELRYKLPGITDPLVRFQASSEPLMVTLGELGIIDESRSETAVFEGIPAEATELTLGWSTWVEARTAVAVPEFDASIQLVVFVVGGLLARGLLRRRTLPSSQEAQPPAGGY